MALEDGGFVGGRMYPLQVVPQVASGEEQPDEPAGIVSGNGHFGFGLRTELGVRVTPEPPRDSFEGQNGRDMFEWHSRSTYPANNGTYHVYAELAWSSTDPETGDPRHYDGSTFIPGVSAVPYWNSNHGYLGIEFEADNVSVDGVFSTPVVRIKNMVVTLFPLDGIDPPILTEDD